MSRRPGPPVEIPLSALVPLRWKLWALSVLVGLGAFVGIFVLGWILAALTGWISSLQ